MKKRSSIQTADFIGWKPLQSFKELKLPNNDQCKLKCCTGIGRKVRIRLGKLESSIRQGIITHLSGTRFIVELDNSGGEIRIDKAMTGSVSIYRNDIEERKMRMDSIKSNIKDQPTVFTENIKPIANSVDDFD